MGAYVKLLNAQNRELEAGAAAGLELRWDHGDCGIARLERWIAAPQDKTEPREGSRSGAQQPFTGESSRNARSSA